MILDLQELLSDAQAFTVKYFTKIVLLTALLVSSSLAWALPDTPILDNFNRANEGPPPAGWTSSASADQEHKIVTNALVNENTTDLGSSTWNTSFGNHQEFYLTITTLQEEAGAPGNGVQILLRADRQTLLFPNGTLYSVRYNRVTGAANDTVQMRSWSAGTPTEIGTATTLGTELAAGDVIGGRIVGTTLQAFRNGVVEKTETTSLLTNAGFVGILSPTSTTLVMDNAGGGNVGGSGMLFFGSE